METPLRSGPFERTLLVLRRYFGASPAWLNERIWTLVLCLSGLSLSVTGCGRSGNDIENPVSPCCTLHERCTISRGINGRPISLAFSQDGRWLAAGNMISGTAHRVLIGEVLLWDLTAAEKFTALRVEAGSVGPVAFSSDSKLLAAVARDPDEPDRVVVFDVGGGRESWTFAGHTGEVDALAFSPDNKMLVTCGATLVVTEGWERGEVRIWDLVKKIEVARAERFEDPYMAVVLMPGGDRFVTGVGQRRRRLAKEGQLTIWDSKTCKPLRTSDWEGKVIRSIASVPGTEMVVAGSQDGALSFWSGSELKLIDSYDVRPKRAPRMYVMSLDVSRDGKMLAVAIGYWIRGGGEGELQLWDIQRRRKCCTVLTTSRRPVTCALFSPKRGPACGGHRGRNSEDLGNQNESEVRRRQWAGQFWVAKKVTLKKLTLYAIPCKIWCCELNCTKVGPDSDCKETLVVPRVPRHLQWSGAETGTRGGNWDGRKLGRDYISRQSAVLVAGGVMPTSAGSAKAGQVRFWQYE